MAHEITRTALLLSFALFSANVVLAQGDKADTPKEARVLFSAGVESFEAGRFAEAVDAFRKAYAIAPSWKIHYNIGQCEAALKNYGVALDSFETYIAEGGDEVPRERQDELLKEIDRLRRMVGIIEVDGEDGDEIRINGRSRGTLPAARRSRVAMGETKLVVLRENNPVLEEAFRLSGGDTMSFEVETESGPPAPTVAPEKNPTDENVETETAPPTQEREAAPEKKRVWTWVALGVGAAALVGGGVVGGLAMGKKSDLEKENCEGTSCYSGSKADFDTVNTMNLTADILYGVGAVGIVTGVVLFFVEPKRHADEKIAIAPTAQPGGASLTLTGRF